MKFYIQIKKYNFLISNSIAFQLKNTETNYQVEVLKENVIFILKDYTKLFTVIPTISLTHFYVRVSSKKYRISKELYYFLNLTVKPNKKNKTITPPLI
jgi:hypothetical protein